MSSPVFNYLHFVLSSPVDKHGMIKQLSIKTAKERKNEIPIIVSKMYSAALTKRCNNELIKRKKLRKDNHRIQSLHEKCPNTIFFCSVFSCIQSEHRKLRTRKKTVFCHFPHSELYVKYPVMLTVKHPGEWECTLPVEY